MVPNGTLLYAVMGETKSFCFPYSPDPVGAVSFTVFLSPHMVGLGFSALCFYWYFFKKVINSFLLLIPFICNIEAGIAQSLISAISIQVHKGRLDSFPIFSCLLATTLVV